MKTKNYLLVLILGIVAGSYAPTFAATDMKHVRAVHAMGNWGGNIQGFKPPPLVDAQSLTAEKIEVQAHKSPWVDSKGVTHPNELAQIKFTNVSIGSGTKLPTAGFWVVRDGLTGDYTIQFRPSLDINLSGIKGFSSDINITMLANDYGKLVYIDDIGKASGDALILVKAVLANSVGAIANAQYTVGTGVSFGSKDTLPQTLSAFRNALADADKIYFDYLKSINSEWIGISVAIHYDSFSNPTVVARNCSNGAMYDSGGNYTSCAFYDEDLKSFIARAKENGFKIYLTLAFETSLDLDATPSTACGKSTYKMSRWLLGRPYLDKGSNPAKCIADNDWWWNPSHPLYATNVNLFFKSYTQVAVKYAALGQQAGVDLFSLGTETDHLFKTRPDAPPAANHFKSQLLEMVAAVRAVYRGLLTYDQGWDAIQYPERFFGGNGAAAVFNDLGLDVVGISAYFELTKTPPNRVLSVSELETLWDGVFKNYLLPIRERNPGKSIIFTETGYVDDINSPSNAALNITMPEPAYSENSPTNGMLQQANIYQSFYNVNERYGDVVAGTFFWGNDYFPYYSISCRQIDFTLHCHPAKNVVANAYSKWLTKDINRVFAWAEYRFPQLFPPGSATITASGYILRYYPSTQTYLAVKDGKVFVHNGKEWNYSDVGTLRGYLDAAGDQGF